MSVPLPSVKPVVAAKREAYVSRPIEDAKPSPRPVVKAEEPKEQKIEAPRIAAPKLPPPSTVKAVASAEKPAAKIQSFPVQTRTLSESGNPGLAPTPATARKDPPKIAATGNKDGMLPFPEDESSEETSVPVPPQIPAAKEKSAGTAMATPPVPKHRPDVQRAPDSFVAAARAKAQIPAAKKDPSPMPALASIVKQEGPPVMAMPPGAIKSEKLFAPKTDASDRLARQIVSPSKAELVDAIEKISSRTQQQIGNPKLQPPQIIASAPPTKEDIIDITADIPTRTAKAEISDITARPDDAAAIEPAAGNASGFIPRMPNDEKFEEEFVTLKFAPGAREPDEKIQSEMENGILTLLQKNPAWRVQIQAFASTDGADVSNARRISLARALAIRTWLMDKGVEASRMDVRALGAETDRNPADRVDMVFFNPQKNG
jgi:outer membrane protein OmpA-like peptidoglycan-associated protein